MWRQIQALQNKVAVVLLGMIDRLPEPVAVGGWLVAGIVCRQKGRPTGEHQGVQRAGQPQGNRVAVGRRIARPVFQPRPHGALRQVALAEKRADQGGEGRAKILAGLGLAQKSRRH